MPRAKIVKPIAGLFLALLALSVVGHLMGIVPWPPTCTIKGNIGFNTGQRLYYVPGAKHYMGTFINKDHGERWFCSAHEAEAAGWQRSWD